MPSRSSSDSRSSWRGVAAGRGGGAQTKSKWPRLALLGSVLMAIATAVCVLIWMLTPPAQVVLVAASAIQGGRPTAKADLEAIRQAIDLKSSSPVDFNLPEFSETIKILPVKNTAVIFVSSPARIGKLGEIELVQDSGTGESTSFAELLKAVRNCPAGAKLLILDLYDPPATDATWGLSAADLHREVSRVLKTLKDKDLWALTSAGPGEESRMSEVSGRSVFVSAVAAGLGEDSATADTNGDSLVSTSELTDYVRGRVDDWSHVHFGTSQIPIMHAPPSGKVLKLTRVAPVVPKVAAKAKEKAEKSAGLEVEAGAKTKAPVMEPSTYPKRLLDGWAKLAAWKESRFYEIAPRPYRNFQRALRDAETDWRLGLAETELLKRLEPVFHLAAKDENSWRISNTLQEPRSLAQAQRMQSFEPNPDLNAAVSELAKKAATDKKLDLSAEWKKLVDEFLKHNLNVKAADSAALAQAVIEAAGSDQEPSNARLITLDSWLKIYQDEPKFAETAALRRIANATSSWNDPALAAQVLAVVLDGEKLDAEPLVFTEFADELKKAAALRHRAEVLFASPGFVSKDLARKAALAASEEYGSLQGKSAPTLKARSTATEALLLLLESAPAIELSGPESLKAWKETAALTADLVTKLQEPDRTAPSPLALRTAMTKLQEPLSGSALSALIKKSEDQKRTFAEYVALQAVLASTVPTTQERMALVKASRKLADYLDGLHRTHDFTTRPIAAESEVAATSPRPVRAEIAKALLVLAGQTNPTNLADEIGSWERLGTASESDKSGVNRDVLTRIAPPWLKTGRLDDKERTPGWRLLKETSAKHLAWLADRAEYEANDLNGEVFTFEKDSAGKYHDLLTVAEPSKLLKIGLPDKPLNPKTGAAIIRLTPNDPESKQAEVRLLTPDDKRLKVTIEAPRFAADTQLRDVPLPADNLDLRVVWKADQAEPNETAARSPAGVLLEVAMGGRLYSARVKIEGLPTGNEPEILWVAAGQETPQPMLDTLQVRPLNGPQSFAIMVKNPSDTVKTVRVRLTADGESIDSEPVVLKKDQPERVKFHPTKEAGELRELRSGKVTVRVLSQPGDEELSRKETAIVVLDPADYIEASAGRFQPRTSTDPTLNRLEIHARQKQLPPGAAKSKVKLNTSFLVDRSRGKPKNEDAELDVGAERTLLFVEGFFLQSTGTEGTFYLDVDEVPRALKFSVPLRANGGQEARRADKPAMVLPLNLPKFVDASLAKSPSIVARVDNAPDDARLKMTIKETNSGVAGTSISFETPRKRSLQSGFDASGFLLHASVSDWSWDRGFPGGTGERLVEVVLFDAQGTVLSKANGRIILDKEKPHDATVRLLGPVPAGATSVPIEASASAISGISRVEIYQGRMTKDGAAPSGDPKAKDDTGRSSVRINVPIDAAKPGVMYLTARFVNGIGKEVCQELEANVAAAEPKEGAGAAGGAMKKPGGIAGHLYEGDLAQPRVTVILKDKSGKEFLNKATAADGSFQFENLEPGKYSLEAEKTGPLKTASQSVTVESGKTLRGVVLKLK